ncbi:hypothetical protein D9M73_221090 [compost metagenome]
MHPAASAKLRRAKIPSRTAAMATITPMEMKSASLSLVPKVAIAKSLSHGGVRSMNTDPMATSGADEVAKNAETN